MFAHIQTADDRVCLGGPNQKVNVSFFLRDQRAFLPVADCGGFPPTLRHRVASVIK